MTDNGAVPELSKEVELSSLGAGGKLFPLQADDEACARIAKRLGIPRVKSLAGEIRLSATKKDIKATGVVRAELVRECVASLEEMDEAVDEAFELEFLREEDPEQLQDGREEWELPEVHEGEIFDVGELLVQQLSLAMDPFPRKEGARSLAEDYGVEAESSPFAVLKSESKKSE